MGKENVFMQLNCDDYDEEVSVKPPYWWVEYIDDYGLRHLATVKTKEYLQYLQRNYIVVRVKVVEA